jgi:hypothetical protein
MRRVDFSPYVAELRASAPHPPKIAHVTSGVSFHKLHAALNQFAKTYHYVFDASKPRRKDDMECVVMKCCRRRCRYRLSVFSEASNAVDGALSWLEYDSDDMVEHNHELDGSDLTDEDRKRMKRVEFKRKRNAKRVQQVEDSDTRTKESHSGDLRHGCDDELNGFNDLNGFVDPKGSNSYDCDNGDDIMEEEFHSDEEPLFLYSEAEDSETSPAPEVAEQPQQSPVQRLDKYHSLFLHSEEDDDEVQEIVATNKTNKTKSKPKKKKKIEIISLDSDSEEAEEERAQSSAKTISQQPKSESSPATASCAQKKRAKSQTKSFSSSTTSSELSKTYSHEVLDTLKAQKRNHRVSKHQKERARVDEITAKVRENEKLALENKKTELEQQVEATLSKREMVLKTYLRLEKGLRGAQLADSLSRMMRVIKTQVQDELRGVHEEENEPVMLAESSFIVDDKDDKDEDGEYLEEELVKKDGRRKTSGTKNKALEKAQRKKERKHERQAALMKLLDRRVMKEWRACPFCKRRFYPREIGKKTNSAEAELMTHIQLVHPDEVVYLDDLEEEEEEGEDAVQSDHGYGDSLNSSSDSEEEIVAVPRSRLRPRPKVVVDEDSGNEEEPAVDPEVEPGTTVESPDGPELAEEDAEEEAEEEVEEEAEEKAGEVDGTEVGELEPVDDVAVEVEAESVAADEITSESPQPVARSPKGKSPEPASPVGEPIEEPTIKTTPAAESVDIVRTLAATEKAAPVTAASPVNTGSPVTAASPAKATAHTATPQVKTSQTEPIATPAATVVPAVTSPVEASSLATQLAASADSAPTQPPSSANPFSTPTKSPAKAMVVINLDDGDNEDDVVVVASTRSASSAVAAPGPSHSNTAPDGSDLAAQQTAKRRHSSSLLPNVPFRYSRDPDPPYKRQKQVAELPTGGLTIQAPAYAHRDVTANSTRPTTFSSDVTPFASSADPNSAGQGSVNPPHLPSLGTSPAGHGPTGQNFTMASSESVISTSAAAPNTQGTHRNEPAVSSSFAFGVSALPVSGHTSASDQPKGIYQAGASDSLFKSLLEHEDTSIESESSVSEGPAPAPGPAPEPAYCSNALTLSLAGYFRNNRQWYSSIFTEQNSQHKLRASLICYAHVIGVKLAKLYPEVLMVDMQKSMVEIGGVDATGQHFPIAFGHILGHTKGVHYTIRWLKEVVYSANGIIDPGVIVSTCELPQEAYDVFPKVKVMRNRCQLDSLVLTRTQRQDSRLSDMWMYIMGLRSKSLVKNVNGLLSRVDLVPFTDFDRWFAKNKKTLCPAFFDRYPHFSEVKVIPGALQGTATRADDPVFTFEALSRNIIPRYKFIVDNQNWERKVFASERPEDALLNGRISHKAMDLINFQRTAAVEKCGGQDTIHRWDRCVSRVLGIPCRHSLDYVNRRAMGLTVTEIHPHWHLMNPELLYREDFAPTLNTIVYPETAVQSNQVSEEAIRSMFGQSGFGPGRFGGV